MKKTNVFGLALSMAVAFAVVGCSDEQKVKTVLNPTVAESSDSSLTVDKVILTDSITIIDFSWKYNDQGTYLFMSPDACIEAGGKRYNVIGSKNIPITEDYFISEEIRFRTGTFSLVFPAIPMETDSISFYETTKEGESGWKVKGIDLTGKAATFNYQTKKDSKRYIKEYNAYQEKIQQERYEMAREQAREQERRRAAAMEEARKPYRCKYCGKRFYQEYQKNDCEMIHGLRGFAGALNR